MELSPMIARYITMTNYEDLPDEVISFTKLCILDYFGSAFAGAKKEPIQMIDELVKEMGGEEQATLVTGGKSSVMNAAFVNGAASHIVELDDIHKASIIHAATVVVPAALAMAEWKALSGKDLITAVAIGYEVCYRIGEAVTPSHYYYWHNTATCGTFGATAASAKLLGLNEEEIIHALGNAGTQAAGLWEFIEDGAMTKQLHPGKAAMNGVISTILAKKGFTGARKILEGNRGFFKAMSEKYDENKVINRLGEEFKIVENSFKIHASCRHTHHAMDLMIELVKEKQINVADVDNIIVRTYQVAINITDNVDPTTQYASKFSLQFCTALALLKGQGGLDDFNDATLWDEEIRSLMERVKVVVDPEIDAAYPEKWGAKVDVHLKNGSIITKQTDFPKGDPENPVTSDELIDKFMKLAKDLPIEQRKIFASRVLALETLDTISELFESVKTIDSLG
ncbi:MmgE/PrpD family protein [Halalkalibacter nanhaiisediminis]|uniref:2-methylcitrate dehydratase PrpD n=1 Tax=Halalkalibacter nanhaiisediminis TaxID=688079 RepID=A0A562QD94_9BACI|nr:MmgE/PrpD family protein [Halalkalibacter nanhaiisediminis]TWI54732.1 2-methylcitrate dehydratase PrpD [Halalkalibacter nanhaiisediminis]